MEVSGVSGNRKKVIVLSGGPNRIGQGIEALVKEGLRVKSIQEYHREVVRAQNFVVTALGRPR